MLEYASELSEVHDEPETELNNDYCTFIFQIKMDDDIQYWIGAENAQKAIQHIPDMEAYNPDVSIEARVITLDKANSLKVDSMDGVIRRMSSYFNENADCGEMVVCVEY